MAANPRRDLAHYLRVYDNALAPGLCAQILTLWQQHASQQQRNGQGVHPALSASAWTELDLAQTADAQLSQQLAQQVADYRKRYVSDLGLSLPLSPARRTDRWIVKRYRAGSTEQFQPHFDAVGPAAGRYLVFLWYLNSVRIGGATRFVDLNVEVAAQAGRLLMFPPYWMFQHAGLPALSEDKFILSTYLIYG